MIIIKIILLSLILLNLWSGACKIMLCECCKIEKFCMKISEYLGPPCLILFHLFFLFFLWLLSLSRTRSRSRSHFLYVRRWITKMWGISDRRKEFSDKDSSANENCHTLSVTTSSESSDGIFLFFVKIKFVSWSYITQS